MKFNRRLPLLLLSAALALVLAACGTTTVVDTWESTSFTGEKPEKLAVLVVWPQAIERLAIERDMVAQLRDRGLNAVESVEIPGMRGELTAENAEIALRNANVDGLLVVFIIGSGGGGTHERDLALEVLEHGALRHACPLRHGRGARARVTTLDQQPDGGVEQLAPGGDAARLFGGRRHRENNLPKRKYHL